MGKVIGHYWIRDEEKYKWHWMGKSPKVRKAVEIYMVRHKPGNWNTSFNETAEAVGKEVGCSKMAIYNNVNSLRNKGIIEPVL